MLSLYERHREMLKQARRPPQAAGMILDELFGNPVFSVSRYCARTGGSTRKASVANRAESSKRDLRSSDVFGGFGDNLSLTFSTGGGSET